MGQSTQKDVLAELQEVKQEKEILERNLRELAANMTSISKKDNPSHGLKYKTQENY